ncbi:MAG: hypothetical protein Q8834_02975, partial [Candidatus Phytoplasma australasiaticum]|nr:hypothetical protein [Candidatus Phytoplasma australasiaticum]
MAENKMKDTFIKAQDNMYYEKMFLMTGAKFTDLVKIWQALEEGIKSGRITNLAALQESNKAIQSDSIGGAFKKKKDGMSTVMTIQERRSNQMLTCQNLPPQSSHYGQYTQMPQPYYQPSPAPYAYLNKGRTQYEPWDVYSWSKIKTMRNYKGNPDIT